MCDLPKGVVASIVDVAAPDDAMEAKLREIGFAEGDEVELLATGPLAARPLCIRLNETMIALRPEEARGIMVRPR